MEKQYKFSIHKANGELIVRTNDIKIARQAISELKGGAYIQYLDEAIGEYNNGVCV